MCLRSVFAVTYSASIYSASATRYWSYNSTKITTISFFRWWVWWLHETKQRQNTKGFRAWAGKVIIRRMVLTSQNYLMTKLENMGNLAQCMAQSMFFKILITFPCFSPSLTPEGSSNVPFQMYKTRKVWQYHKSMTLLILKVLQKLSLFQ